MGKFDFDGEEEVLAPEPEPIREVDHGRVTPAIKERLRSLDHVDFVYLFGAVVMKKPTELRPCSLTNNSGRGSESGDSSA